MCAQINFKNKSTLIDHHNLNDIDDDLTSVTDFDLLRFQLIHQRKKLFTLIESLVKLELSFGNVIMRSDYENLFNKQKCLHEEYKALKHEYQYLGHSCLYLINKSRDLIDERNKYYNEWQINKSILTPRPDWDKVSDVIDGGMERWKTLSTGKTSQQLVDVLLREIVHGNQMESLDERDYFVSMGDDTSVLPLLRIPKTSKIINRKMRRHMTGLLIKDIWIGKTRQSKTNSLKNSIKTEQCNYSETQHSLVLVAPNIPEIRSAYSSDEYQKSLVDYVADYFEARFNSKTIAIEMGYNLRDACQRYRNSERINLFWGILTGQIEEMVYHYQMKSIRTLLRHFMKMQAWYNSLQEPTCSSEEQSILPRKAIVSEPNSPIAILQNRRLSLLSLLSMKGHRELKATQNGLKMTNEQFCEALTLFYRNKTSSQITELYQAAKHDLPYSNEFIEFNLLFVEDDETRYSEFLSTLIKQMNEEKISYVEEIKQILLGYPLISVTQFCRAIYMIDPNISQSELHRYIRWVFTVKDSRSLNEIKPLDLEDLLRRLESCACFKHETLSLQINL